MKKEKRRRGSSILLALGVVLATLLAAVLWLWQKASRTDLRNGKESMPAAAADILKSDHMQERKMLCVASDHAVIYSTGLSQMQGGFCTIDKEGTVLDAPYTLEKFEKVVDLCADKQGNVVIRSTLAGDTYVKVLDKSGACLCNLNLTALQENQEIREIRMDLAGLLYVLAKEDTANVLSVYDTTGKKQGQFTLLGQAGCLRRLGSGEVAHIYPEEDTQNGGIRFVAEVYAGGKKGKKYVLPITSVQDFEMVQDGGVSDLYYLDVNYQVYGYDLEKKQSMEIVNLYEAGVSSDDFIGYQVLDEATVYALTEKRDKKGFYLGDELYLVRAGAGSESRQELKMAVIGVDGRLDEAAQAFNRSSEDYYIKFQDYSGFEDAKKQIVLDLMSGDAPDILCLTGLNEHKLAGQRLLEDLNPYLQESGIGEELDANIIKLLSDQDGGLYQICFDYEIDAVITTKDTLKEDGDWPEHLVRQASDKQQFLAGSTAQEVLDELVANNYDRLVDDRNGSCYFDTQEFVSLLDCAKALGDKRLQAMSSYGLEVILDGMADGKALGTDFGWGNGILSYQVFEPFCGGEPAIVSYPLTQTEGIGFTAGACFGICAFSGQKEGAWQFLCSQLSLSGQKRYADLAIPINQRALDEFIKRMTTVDGYMDEEQRMIEPVDEELVLADITIKLRPALESEADRFRALLSSVGHRCYRDEMIGQIIEEETKAFWEGRIEAKDAAGRIQNRVSLYLQE